MPVSITAAAAAAAGYGRRLCNTLMRPFAFVAHESIGDTSFFRAGSSGGSFTCGYAPTYAPPPTRGYLTSTARLVVRLLAAEPACRA